MGYTRHRRLFAAAVTASLTLTTITATGAAPAPRTIFVSPSGAADAAGTERDPVSIEGARDLVRERNDSLSDDLIVTLADGWYRLREPLRLTREDSGGNGHSVIWRAARGARPVIAGSSPVTGWQAAPGGSGIYQAAVQKGSATRALVVNGKLAPRAATRFTRPANDGFLTDGLRFTPAMNFLKSLTPEQLAGVEIRSSASFTDRYNRVEKISDDGTTLRMSQPGWRSNTYGWDHMASPFEDHGFFAENALAFLDEPGEWFLDGQAGRLYYKPPAGVRITDLNVELPRLETLLSVSGTRTGETTAQAHHIAFEGIHFTGTTWNEPTTSGAYADQQTGTFISVDPAWYPPQGYPANFEATRPKWNQVPSAVQVSAATDIRFTGASFHGLGAGGLGVGNDANAHLSGVGLSAQRVTIENSTFTEIGANGLTVGGVQQEAHHPGTSSDGTRDPAVGEEEVARRTISGITVRRNVIHRTARLYNASDGMLMTYFQNSLIEHNEITDQPYSGMGLGYGWGSNDAGGSTEYLARGLYDYQPIFPTPTTLKNNRIVGNYVAQVVSGRIDGGGFYNLSAHPGGVYQRNFFTSPDGKGFHMDEGSRHLTFVGNVMMMGGQGTELWLDANLNGPTTGDFTGHGNYTNKVAPRSRNTSRGIDIGSTLVKSPFTCDWPKEAQAIAYESGIPPRLRAGNDPNRPAPGTGACLRTSFDKTGPTTGVLTATFSGDSAGRHSLSAAAPENITLKPRKPGVWDVTAAKAGVVADIDVTATWQGVSKARRTTLDFAGPVSPPLRSTGNTGYQATEVEGRYGIRQAGKDLWTRADDYASIFRPDVLKSGDTLRASVTSVEVTDDWSKTGIVVRNDLSRPGSPGGYAALLVTGSNGVVLSVDSDADGHLDTNVAQVTDVAVPADLEIVRDGNTLRARVFEYDHEEWIDVGTARLTGADEAMDAGLIHHSHDEDTFGWARFERFGVFSPAPATRTAGQEGHGNAVRLNGPEDPNEHIDLPDNVLGGLTDFTIAAWVNRATTTDQEWSRIFDFGTGESAYMFLAPDVGGDPGLRFAITTKGGAGEQQITSPTPLPTGWHHVAVTLSGTTGTLYVDGEPVATNDGLTLDPSALGATTDNWIGRSQYGDPLLKATVDDFRIYGRALTQAEIRSLPGTPGGGDVAWYRFDEDGGTQAKDSSGKGRDATVVTSLVPVPD
ncbi:LamG-like jellyroll fold domain-containing protein [Nonomuraea sp. NPDC050404]|uniref:LamG-like jellyroll fold domain-containing protein n=1 Tax=Nonomuraea sp. NPDC050404 TaxID=3155783 RepID=UPI0033EEB063